MKRFLLYCVFGGLGVLTDLVVYTLLVAVGLDFRIANILGYASGTLVSFLLNRRVTFGMLDKVWRRLLTFCGVAAVGLGLSTLLLWLFVDVFGLQEVVAKILTLPFVVVLQFGLNRAITFRSPASTTVAPPADPETEARDILHG